jgi:hypothetical protein
VRALALAAAALSAACLASTARATTEPALLMHVKVALTSSKISLSSSYAARGLEVEFRVRNQTSTRRTFSIAGKTIVVPAKSLRITAVSFQARGRYKVVSRTPKSRVTTTFRVT